jgi:hypothetical protein
MKQEDHFSIYGAGYAEQRRAGFRTFRNSIPQRPRVIGASVAASLILVGALTMLAHSVMSTAKAGTEFGGQSISDRGD